MISKPDLFMGRESAYTQRDLLVVTIEYNWNRGIVCRKIHETMNLGAIMRTSTEPFPMNIVVLA